MAVAFFDLDHTLLAGDSDQLWGDYLRARGEVDGDFQVRKNAFYAAYQRGELDIYAFHRFMLATVKGQRLSALQATQRQFDCYFYSDSPNDLPLLQTLRYPQAVTPDATLRAHAESNAWLRLEWQ